MPLRTGFIGLGNIGKPMAARLAPAGFDTTVYDIAEEPVRELVAGGARAAASPRELAENADVVGICVPEDRHVFAVMEGEDGVLAGLSEGDVVAIHSTVQPTTARTLHERARERGASVLDACVTGGAEKAADGTLTYLVGGDAEALERIRPYLDASSEKIIHTGELGNGARLKLCINTLTYINWAAAFESLKLAEACGLPVEQFLEAVRSNGQLSEMQQRYVVGLQVPADARASEGFQALMRNHTAIAEKDLRWALDLGHASEHRMPVAGLVAELMGRFYQVEGR